MCNNNKNNEIALIVMKNMIMAGIVTKFMEVTLPEDMLMEVAA